VKGREEAAPAATGKGADVANAPPRGKGRQPGRRLWQRTGKGGDRHWPGRTVQGGVEGGGCCIAVREGDEAIHLLHACATVRKGRRVSCQLRHRGVGSWEGWHQLRHRLGREKEGAEPVVPPQGRDERGLVLSPLPLGKGGGPAAGLTTMTD